MTSEQDLETARQMYEAFADGDIEAVLDRVTDDVDWSTDAAIESAPWYGPRHGKDGLVGFFEGIGETGPVTEFTPLAYASNDDGDVMVFIRYAFTVTATGKHVAMNMHHYWKFRDGKACFVRSSRGHRAGRCGPDALTRIHKRPGPVPGRSKATGWALGASRASRTPQAPRARATGTLLCCLGAAVGGSGGHGAG